MDETAKQVLTFLGTAGGSAFLLLIGKGIAKLFTGAAQRERVKTTSLVRRTETAEQKRYEADIKRREAEEHVAILKSQIRGLIDPITGKAVVPLERPEEEE